MLKFRNDIIESSHRDRMLGGVSDVIGLSPNAAEYNPLMCSFGGGSSEPAGNTTSTVTTVPWSGQQPYLTAGFADAKNLLNNYDPQYYQGTQVAPFSPAQNQALTGIQNQAHTGESITNAAMNFGTQLQNGSYLNSNPATGYFQQLANSNLGLNNPGSSALQGMMGTNPAANAPGASTLSNLTGYGANGLPASSELSNLMYQNIGQNNVGSNIQQNLAGTNQGLNQPGAGTLQQLQGQNAGTQNGGNATLQNYANGGMLNSNPYQDATAQSVMAQVLPQIQKQFSNSLGNPAAAYASAQGVTSALAPLEYSNYQQQQQNQLGAANTLGQNAIAGSQLQGNQASQLAGLGLSGAQLQGQLGQNLASNALSGQSNQGTFANMLGNLGLGTAGVQSGAASTLLGSNLQGSAQQQQAASQLGQNALAGGNLQAQAATGISNPYQQTLTNMVQGNALAPQTQQLAYGDLNNLYNAGTQSQTQLQNQINADMNKWNYNQQLPYNQLNQYMSTIGGNYGSTSTTQQPYYQNQGAGVLGDVASGLGIFGSLLSII